MRALLIALLSLAPAGSFANKTAPEAKAHFEAGERAYRLGDFRKAVEEYGAAYQSFPSPVLLYDMGQCHRQLGENEKALFSYRRFVEDAPPAHAAREDAERFIKTLEEALEQEKQAKSTPPTGPAKAEPVKAEPSKAEPELRVAVPAGRDPSASASPSRRPALVAAIVCGALAVGAGVAGAVLLVRASQLDDTASQTPTLDASLGLTASATDHRIAGATVVGVGGLALVASAVSLGLAARPGRHGTAAIRLVPTRGGGALAWAGAW